jgi:hypothetical protein
MIRTASPEEDSEAVAAVLIESQRVVLPFAPFTHPEYDVRQCVRNQLLRTHKVVIWEEDGSIVAGLAMAEGPTVSWFN